jgi:hypothetical protein
MKRAVILFICLFGLAALSPAPIKRIGDVPHTPSQSQAQVAAEQSLQKVTGEVGSVPLKDELPLKQSPSNLAGSQIVQGTVLPREQSAIQANTVLKEADIEIRDSRLGTFKSMLVMLVILLALATCLYGAKRWLDKQFPYKKRRKRKAAMKKA